jgi:hypothetical protein
MFPFAILPRWATVHRLKYMNIIIKSFKAIFEIAIGLFVYIVQMLGIMLLFLFIMMAMIGVLNFLITKGHETIPVTPIEHTVR